jgi:hypothetical protein
MEILTKAAARNIFYGVLGAYDGTSYEASTKKWPESVRPLLSSKRVLLCYSAAPGAACSGAMGSDSVRSTGATAPMAVLKSGIIAITVAISITSSRE